MSYLRVPQNRLRLIHADNRRAVLFQPVKTQPVISTVFKPSELTLDEFSYRFVKGGLVCGRSPMTYRQRPMARPYYEGDQPDMFEKNLQKKKKTRPRRRPCTKVFKLFVKKQKKNRHRYYPDIRYKRPSPIKRKDQSRLYLIRPHDGGETKYKRFWRVFKHSRPVLFSRLWFTQDFKFQLTKSSELILKSLRRLKSQKPVEPVMDQVKILYCRRFSKHIRQKAMLERRRFLRTSCYRSRWKLLFKVSRGLDPVYNRWLWSTKHRGSIIGDRYAFINHDRFHRLHTLHKNLYCLRSIRYKIKKNLRHLQVIDGLPRARRLRRDRRRYFQRRLIRLRRTKEIVPSLNNYYSVSCNKTFEFYRVNRFSVMELNNIVRRRPFIDFLFSEHKIRYRLHPQYFFPYFYNLFIKFSQHRLLTSWRRDRRRRYYTRSGNLRMKVLKDHPIWGLHFNFERRRRFEFLRDTLIDKFSRRRRLAKYEKVPVRYSFESNIYAEKVDTRRKLDGPEPVDRSLMSFFLSFIDGLSVEKRQKKTFPATMGALFSFNRASINVEVDLAPAPTMASRTRQIIEEVEQVERKVYKAQRPSLWRRLAYYPWFYVFTPLWYVYYWYARFFTWFLHKLKITFQDVFDQFRGWMLFYFRTFQLLFVSPWKWMHKKIRESRVVRLLNWVYTSWIYIDLLENYHYEQDQAKQDEVENDVEADDEEDPDGDWLEDDVDDSHTDIGYNQEAKSSFTVFFHGSPVWEWYVQNIPDEEIEEVFDETSYIVRFIVRPFVDFLVRLPFWAFLEFCTMWLEIIKHEYHRVWFKIITYGNRSGKVSGRWWKIPLILIKWSIRVCLWLTVALWMTTLISSGDLKLIVTYNFGCAWYEEYYYLYICVTFLASIFLVGPLSLRDFCFKELGFEGLTYIFMAPMSVARPEGYQPQRSYTKLFQHIFKWEINYGEKEFLIWESQLSGRYQEPSLPNGIFNHDDLRVILAQFGEFGMSYGQTTEEDRQLVRRHRRRLFEKYTYNMSDRHPIHVRNEWYRRDKGSWDHMWTLGFALKEEDKRYKSADTGNQYWNRTIVQRQEYPQNLRDHFVNRYRG